MGRPASADGARAPAAKTAESQMAVSPCRNGSHYEGRAGWRKTQAGAIAPPAPAILLASADPSLEARLIQALMPMISHVRSVSNWFEVGWLVRSPLDRPKVLLLDCNMGMPVGMNVNHAVMRACSQMIGEVNDPNAASGTAQTVPHIVALVPQKWPDNKLPLAGSIFRWPLDVPRVADHVLALVDGIGAPTATLSQTITPIPNTEVIGNAHSQPKAAANHRDRPARSGDPDHDSED